MMSAVNRPLNPEQLGQLTKQMIEAKDPKEADRLQEEIVRGFYGEQLAAMSNDPQIQRELRSINLPEAKSCG